MAQNLCSPQFAIALVAPLALSVLGILPLAAADGPEIATVKQVYDSRQEIEVRFSNAPGERRDLVAIAGYGWKDRRQLRRRRLKGKTTGTVTFKGQVPGRYEARLHRNGDEVVARTSFAVGESCLEPRDDGSFCDFGVRLGKETYEPGEQIEVSFEGATGNGLDRILLVREKPDDTLSPIDSRAYTERIRAREMTGSHTFAGLPEGNYEAQLRWQVAREDEGKVGARVAFTVDDGNEDAPPAGPHIATQKDVYDPGEPIIVSFTNAPGHKRDRITLAKPWMKDRQGLGRARLRGAIAGEVEVKGRRAGRYEARLINGKTRQVVARHTFVVGESCAGSPPEGAAFCELALRTTKRRYAAGEPIEVVYEGAPGNRRDWITIVQKTGEGQYRPPPNTRSMSNLPPDGERKPWTRLKGAMAGSHVFDGLDEGTYEVQLYLRPPRSGIGEIAARATFTVGGEAEAPLAVQELYGDEDKRKKTARRPAPADRLRTVERSMRTDRPGTGERSTSANPRSGRQAEGQSEELPAAADNTAVPFEPALPEAGVAGSWLGHIRCKDALSRSHAREPRAERALLKIEGRQKLTAEFFVMTGRGANGFGLTMSGEFDQADQTVSLSPQEWIYDAGRRQPPGLKARIDQTGVRMEGELENTANGCAGFRAVKFMRDDRPTYARGLIPQWEQNRRALIHEATCVPLLKWVSSGEIVESEGIEIPSQILDTNAFYRVTGKPYDLWTEADGRAFRKLLPMCQSILRRSRDVSHSALAREAHQNHNELLAFLLKGAPTDSRRSSGRDHLRFLSNYTQVVAVRNARLYTDLALEEVKNLPDGEGSINEIVATISGIAEGHGVFVALSEADRTAAVASLTNLKENMSGRMIDAAFSAFEIGAYKQSLDGLKRAWEERKAIAEVAAGYGTDAQVVNLTSDFDNAFAPLSRIVADQLIAAMPAIDGTVDGFLRGKSQKKKIEREAGSYLAEADRERVVDTYEKRNVVAVKAFLPEFRKWLTTNISPDSAGKAELEELSVAMLGTPPEKLQDRSLAMPYDTVAAAIADRNELLKYQVCALPPGFEDLRTIICAEAEHAMAPGPAGDDRSRK